MTQKYCNSLTSYSRRQTVQCKIGDLGLGSDFPIRIQSMTTIDTMDTNGSIKQAISMIESGCELVRITAPSVKEAQNLENIKQGLRLQGYKTPLVADIHFTPNAAELAARIVEKVRINPGNYADKKRFENIDYTDAAYADELERIRNRFLPLIKICKEYGTAMRIGTNHGSLSDRILSRYGDTPLGMVESALEFLKICEDENYFNIAISMKSSNPQVMVQAYRLLVNRLQSDKLKPYPLHLGVTEAGEGEDGRIKSAMGIGTLLEDGVGDTVRVSLTEDPEFEAPVAAKLIKKFDDAPFQNEVAKDLKLQFNPFKYKRRETSAIENFGGSNVPRVIANYSNFTNITPEDLKLIGHIYLANIDKWRMSDLGADYIYTGQRNVDFMLPNGLKQIVDYDIWLKLIDKQNSFPILSFSQIIDDKLSEELQNNRLVFVKIDTENANELFFETLKTNKNWVVLLNSTGSLRDFRKVYNQLIINKVNNPAVLQKDFSNFEAEDIQLNASVDIGGIFLDGFGDGIMISGDFYCNNKARYKTLNSVAFGILQAARTRMSKTEYISCPSCGRTLFDLQETTAKIRKRTDHLKGIKIGIMGCIVNGPGEMADADYGYVGMGKDKISLYKGQDVFKRNVPSSQAVDELIELIKTDGKWFEPQTLEN